MWEENPEEWLKAQDGRRNWVASGAGQRCGKKLNNRFLAVAAQNRYYAFTTDTEP
jgi:hypothetical protein